MDSQGKASFHKAQERAILVFSGKAEGDRKAVVQDLYDALSKTQPHAKYLRDSDMTAEDMYAIADHMREMGLTWEKAYYIPIQCFCVEKPLRYVSQHKQETMGNKGREAFSEAYNHLKGCFLQFLG